MRLLSLACVALALGLPAASRGQAPAAGLQLRGTVRDSAGRVVAGAQVRHLEGDESVSATDDGRFHLTRVPDGTHTLEVRAVGYTPRTLRLVVGPDRGEELDVVLRRVTAAYLLDSVRVTSTPTLRIAAREFEERLHDRRMNGWRFTAADIARLHPVYASDVLRTVPGITVVGEGPLAKVISTRGITTLPPGGGPPKPTIVRGPSRSQAELAKAPGFGECVRVFLNGARINGEVNMMPPSTLRGIEVYRSVDAPVQYTGFDTCAVVLLWTK